MYSDVECPYCEKEQEINHDDGYGYEEGEIYEQQCEHCEMNFSYTTSIHFTHDAKKADCLNDKEHKYKAMTTYPVEFTRMECPDCGNRREPTKEEWKLILNK